MYEALDFVVVCSVWSESGLLFKASCLWLVCEV